MAELADILGFRVSFDSLKEPLYGLNRLFLQLIASFFRVVLYLSHGLGLLVPCGGTKCPRPWDKIFQTNKSQVIAL